MKYEYEFSTEEIEIEISEEWAEVLRELDREEYNCNHRETRRHVTIDTRDEREWMITRSDDPSAMMDAAILNECVNEKKNAIKESLTREQQRLILRHCLRKVSLTDIAKKEGVSQPTLSKRLSKIRKKIKKFL